MGDTAGCTGKRILIPRSEEAATVASLAGISGVDELDGYSRPLCLVGDEVLQLTEAPSRHHAVEVFAPGFRSFPNGLEPFHTDHSAFVSLRFGNDLLGQDMVLVFDAPVLVAGKSGKDALCTPSSFALEGGANLGPLRLENLSSGTIVECAVGRCGGVANAEVYPHGRTGDRFGIDILDDDVDIEPMLLFDHGSRRGPFSRKGFPLVFAEEQGYANAAPDDGKGNRLVPLPVGKDAGVVVNAGGPEFLRYGFALLGRRHCSGNPSNSTDGEVRGKSEFLPSHPIAGVMELDVIEDVFSNGDGKDGVARRRERLAGDGKTLRIGRRWLHPAFDGPPTHGEDCFTNTIGCQAGKGEALLPGLKTGVSAPKRIG